MRGYRRACPSIGFRINHVTRTYYWRTMETDPLSFWFPLFHTQTSNEGATMVTAGHFQWVGGFLHLVLQRGDDADSIDAWINQWRQKKQNRAIGL